MSVHALITPMVGFSIPSCQCSLDGGHVASSKDEARGLRIGDVGMVKTKATEPR